MGFKYSVEMKLGFEKFMDAKNLKTITQEFVEIWCEDYLKKLSNNLDEFCKFFTLTSEHTAFINRKDNDCIHKKINILQDGVEMMFDSGSDIVSVTMTYDIKAFSVSEKTSIIVFNAVYYETGDNKKTT